VNSLTSLSDNRYHDACLVLQAGKTPHFLGLHAVAPPSIRNSRKQNEGKMCRVWEGRVENNKNKQKTLIPRFFFVLDVFFSFIPGFFFIFFVDALRMLYFHAGCGAEAGADRHPGARCRVTVAFLRSVCTVLAVLSSPFPGMPTACCVPPGSPKLCPHCHPPG